MAIGLLCCCSRDFEMLQVFHAHVAKADLNVALLHLVASVLSGCCKCLSRCCAFNEIFKCTMQHETDVAAGFFLIINGWLITFSIIF